MRVVYRERGRLPIAIQVVQHWLLHVQALGPSLNLIDYRAPGIAPG